MTTGMLVTISLLGMVLMPQTGAEPRHEIAVVEEAPAPGAILVRNLGIDGDVVSGELVNTSHHLVRDVRLLVRHTWLWDQERAPGEDSPGRAAYHTIPESIPPGGHLSFNVHPAPPLPARSDGALRAFRRDRRLHGDRSLISPVLRGALGARCLPLVLVAALACGCQPPPVRSTLPAPPGSTQIAELWVEPTDLATRDLLYGVGGPKLAPDGGERYELIELDTRGSSRGYDVKDSKGLTWSVKIGPEAQAEVVVSRLLWAAGYHQPPTYYLAEWTLTESNQRSAQPPGRFRPELPHLRKVGRWSWQQNPFVDSREFRGLIVLNLMLNNWDMKTSNNVLYEITDKSARQRHWYVVRDIGGSLGKTPGRILDGKPNDLEAFEKQGFITGVEQGRVRFDYRRPHLELVDLVTPADVRWACERLAALTPQQWRDAFRAGGYSPDQSERYIRKIQEKIAQGRDLRA